MGSREWWRFSLALSASALIHALLLWYGGKAAVDAGQVDLDTRSAWRLQAVLRHTHALPPHAAVAAPTHPRLAHAHSQDAAGPPKRLSVEPRRDAANQDRVSAPQPQRDQAASAPLAAIAEEASTQALGAALNGAVTQQYMMMRLQQFFTAARAGAKGKLEGRLTPEKMERYRGKHCSFQLAFVSSPEGYDLVRAECDDPDLAKELEAVEWGDALPRPAEYSLPYRGLVVLLAVRGYDVSVGLKPLDN